MRILRSQFALWCTALVPGLLCWEATFTPAFAQIISSEDGALDTGEKTLQPASLIVSEPLSQPEQIWSNLRPSEASVAIPRGLMAPSKKKFEKDLRLASPQSSSRQTSSRQSSSPQTDRRPSSRSPRGGSRPAPEMKPDRPPKPDVDNQSEPSRFSSETPRGGPSDAKQFEHREVLRTLTLQVRGETSMPEQMALELDDKIKSKYEIRLRRPLVRSPQQELAVSFGFAYLDEEAPPPPGSPGGAPGVVPPPLGATGAGSLANVSPPGPPPPSLDLRRPAGRPPAPPAPSPRQTAAPPPASAPPASASDSSPPPGINPPPLPPSEVRTSVIQLGQDYVLRDRNGRWRLASRFDFGTGLLDATATDGAGADGQYFGWNGQLERSQTLGPNHRLRLQLKTQLATDSLLKPQQFKMGKTIRERGLKTRDVSGDNGLLVSLQDQMTVLRDRETQAPLLQISPLLEVGYVWNRNSAPPGRANSHFLTTANLGLLFIPTPFSSLGFNVQMPLFYENDLGETQPEETYAAAVTYRSRW